MKKHILGYKDNSPYNKEPYIDIPSNRITMKGVSQHLIAIPDNDPPIVMKPNQEYLFPNSKKVREVKLQMGGTSIMNGLAGESTVPASPFINLKPFINKYKKKTFKSGGTYQPMIDYLNSLPVELQSSFVQDFESLKDDEKEEVVEYMKGGYYQLGGLSNAELEDKETLITPDGELSKIQGKTHAQGGEKVNLPSGTRIYSEYLKVDPEIASQVLGKKTGKKYSYAELSKKFPTKPYLEVIQEDADDYKVEGAKIKLANNLAKLDTLFYAQEAGKQQQSENRFQLGGTQRPWQVQTENDSWTPVYGKSKYGIPTPESPWTFFEVEQDYIPQVPTDLQLVMPPRNEKSVIPVRSKQPYRKPKPKSNQSDVTSTPAQVDKPEWKPFPVTNPLATTLPQSLSSIGTSINPVQDINQEVTQDAADYIMEQSDSKSYPGSTRDRWKFGISNELAGTVADIGLAMSDKLRVKEPTLYDRRKTPLFTRFVDFDDKEVQRMYNKNIQQIQQSNMPEQVKQAQIAELTSNYRDYQAKVDYGNLQRYEGKRERDTEKLQQYMDQNIDIKVADMENYNQRKARVDELRDAFMAQRKSRVVNALKSYANYADEVRYKNQLLDNYELNPITGNIEFKEKGQSDLKSNLLNQYQQRANNKISLPNGATLTMLSEDTGVVTDANGKVEILKIK